MTIETWRVQSARDTLSPDEGDLADALLLYWRAAHMFECGVELSPYQDADGWWLHRKVCHCPLPNVLKRRPFQQYAQLVIESWTPVDGRTICAMMAAAAQAGARDV